jgi:hypothetical protein
VVHNEVTSSHINRHSTIKLAINVVFHSKAKHIDIEYHYIITLIIKEIIKSKSFQPKYWTLNIFTKSLERINFTKFGFKLSVCDREILDLRGDCKK